MIEHSLANSLEGELNKLKVQLAGQMKEPRRHSQDEIDHILDRIKVFGNAEIIIAEVNRQINLIDEQLVALRDRISFGAQDTEMIQAQRDKLGFDRGAWANVLQYIEKKRAYFTQSGSLSNDFPDRTPQ